MSSLHRESTNPDYVFKSINHFIKTSEREVCVVDTVLSEEMAVIQLCVNDNLTLLIIGYHD